MRSFLNTIVGAGLEDRQKQALWEFLDARRKVPRNQRTEAFTDAQKQEARHSKLFAIWLAGCQIAQDRPIYFWLGLTALAMTLGRAILNLLMGLFV